MLLSDIKIGLENIVADASKSTVQVVNARPETNKELEIVGFRVEIATRRCSKNPVKFPNDPKVKEKIGTLEKLLKKQDFVEVRLVDPVIKLYSMISNGNLISGVSIKADDFEILEDDGPDLLG